MKQIIIKDSGVFGVKDCIAEEFWTRGNKIANLEAKLKKRNCQIADLKHRYEDLHNLYRGLLDNIADKKA